MKVTERGTFHGIGIGDFTKLLYRNRFIRSLTIEWE
ncbi:conserved hypothetical protein [mine drainage metagenome]|uniref:Uncharacterized protein n=1 Tax=mine drainage metagenome TaxID=410659 RepID=A0A3P3ZNR3_9ZZZZ